MGTTDNRCDSIFWTAQEISSPELRAAYLDQVCGSDVALRAQIDEMLAAYPKVQEFLEQPAVGQAFLPATSHPAEAPGTRIGPYKLLQQIGEGGFGVVYMAEQQTPVRRKVALKIIKPGMDTKEVIARFESERQALALMDHPNIAKVLDAGTTGDEAREQRTGNTEQGRHFENAPPSPVPHSLSPTAGRPYFVMELVKGVPITDYCDSNHLPPDERLELFIQVCNALQHAHQKGIIHRDLKPSNVMVTMHDGRPVPKVIDFGVAKATSQTLTERTLFTAYGQMIGTPAYMSPEQAEMSGLDIDTRSDVYSLGVLLYELLTGTTPFEAKRLREAGDAEMARIIKEEEPESVSTRIAKIRRVGSAHQNPRPSGEGSRRPGEGEMNHGGHSPPYNPKSKIPNLKSFAELDWIVARSLEKDRERRYESASSFARDVRRYLSDEPVQACPPSAIYRFRKFAGKHKTAIVTATLIVASLLLCTLVSTYQALRATAAEAQAIASEAKAKVEEQKARSEQQIALAAKEAEAVHRRQAERNFLAAVDAVEQMLANIQDPELRDIPRLGPVQRNILKDAIAYFERIPNQAELSPKIKSQLAQIWWRIAHESWSLNEHDQGRQALQNAIRIITQLVKDNPENDAYRQTSASYCYDARYMYNADDVERLKLVRAASEIFSQLAAKQPDQKRWLYLKAQSLVSIAYSLEASGRRNDAASYRTQADELFERTPEIDTAYNRGTRLYHRGFEIKQSNPEQARELIRQSLAEYKHYFADNRGTSEQRQGYSGHLRVLANEFADRDPEQALKLFDESIALQASTSGNRRDPLMYLIWALHDKARLLRHLASSSAGAADPASASSRLHESEALFADVIAKQRLMTSRFALPTDRYVLAKYLQEQCEYLLPPIDPANSERRADGKLKADALLTEAIQLCRALTAEFSDNADYKSRLAELEKIKAQHFGEKSDAVKEPAP